MKNVIVMLFAVCVTLAGSLAAAHPGHGVEYGEITLGHVLAHVFTSPPLLVLLALLAVLVALNRRVR